MQRSDTSYTLLFAAAVCVVCSALVTMTAVSLKPLQQRNVLLDRQTNVLRVAGLVQPGDLPGAGEIVRLYEERIEPHVVELKTGQIADGTVTGAYDMVRAAQEPATSSQAPPNKAGVMRLPQHGQVFHVVENGQVQLLIIQVWGQGLWSTMYGFLALEPDGKTIRGLTFYDQEETPGLGGEVDNPRWKAQWDGKVAYKEGWEPAITMVKGGAQGDPHGFDAISGATITSRSVESLLNFWLGENGYKAYLKSFATS